MNVILKITHGWIWLQPLFHGYIFQTLSVPKLCQPPCTHQGVVTSFALARLVLLELQVFLPSCRLHRVIGFLMQFVLKAKTTQVRHLLAPSQSLFPLYCSPCFSVKALCWYWLKQRLFVSCQHFPQLVASWEETAIESGEGKKVLTKSRGQRKQPLCHSHSRGNIRLPSQKSRCLE